jgi:hypothetical protein
MTLVSPDNLLKASITIDYGAPCDPYNVSRLHRKTIGEIRLGHDSRFAIHVDLSPRTKIDALARTPIRISQESQSYRIVMDYKLWSLSTGY